MKRKKKTKFEEIQDQYLNMQTIPPVIINEFVFAKGNKAKSFNRSIENHGRRLRKLDSGSKFNIEDIINSKKKRRKKRITKTAKPIKKQQPRKKKIIQRKKRKIIQMKDIPIDIILKKAKDEMNYSNRDDIGSFSKSLTSKMIDEEEDNDNKEIKNDVLLRKLRQSISKNKLKTTKYRKKKRRKIDISVESLREKRIEKENEQIIRCRRYADNTEAGNAILCTDMINMLLSQKLETHNINESKRINILDSEQNMRDEFDRFSNIERKIRSKTLSKKEMKRIFKERLIAVHDHVMNQNRKINGENYDPIYGIPTLYDRRLLNEHINVYDNDIKSAREARMLEIGMQNLYNHAENDIVISEKSGFKNESHEYIKLLWVDDVEDAFRAPDFTKKFKGECIEFYCSNVIQTSEGDIRFKTDHNLNKCKAFEYTGGRAVFYSYPDPHDLGKIQTFENRKPCFFCRKHQGNTRFYQLTSNSEEISYITQQYGVVVNVKCGEHGKRSFKIEVTLLQDKRYRGFPCPELALDTSYLIWDKEHTLSSNGKYWIVGYKIADSACFY